MRVLQAEGTCRHRQSAWRTTVMRAAESQSEMGRGMRLEKAMGSHRRVLSKAVCSQISGERWRLEAKRPARRPLRQWPINRIRAVGREGGVAFQGCPPGGLARLWGLLSWLILLCFSLERGLVIQTLIPRVPEEGLRIG